jgi:hypothetical protein
MVLEELTVQLPALAGQPGLQLLMGQPRSRRPGQEADQLTEQLFGGREPCRSAGRFPGRLLTAQLVLPGRSRVTSSLSPASAWESRRAFAALNRSVAARTASTSPAGSIKNFVFAACE